ncbi:MAG: calcineurin-like phosphoesterase family protein [Paludibacter sp.]|nr:calcineurin-like phosphoesterase family protein [Paludibacter sp.]
MYTSPYHISKLFLIILFTSILYGCEKIEPDPDDNNPNQTVFVKDVIIPSHMSLVKGNSQAISGKGFETGDVFLFKSTNNEIIVNIANFTSSYATFIVSYEIQDGEYTIFLKRNEKQQELGKTLVTIVLNVNVPDKEGSTIKGAVYCGTNPVAGVRVSDGITTVITDANGFYWLNSNKYHGYVFISTPSGYQPKTISNVTPGFWSTLTAGASTVEQHNFQLVEVQAENHIILAAADQHLANRGPTSNNDMAQFNNGFMVDTRNFIASQSSPVYTIMLGDMSWDGYWYSRNYNIADYVTTVSSFPAPMYHVMGNHDNDPYFADDFKAEAKYKKALGPTYFSMDIGQVHYIFLDNTIFINKGGLLGTVGERDYDKYLTDIQMNWLKEDLAAVKDKNKPVIVSFHCPSTSNYNSTFTTQLTFSPTYKATEFHRCFDGFSDVHFLNGHTHNNGYTTIGANIQEHNIAATSETWWWSGKTTGLNICRDGSPSGYAVFEVTGTDVKWYYKGIGLDKSKQFITYDMNSVKEFFNRADVSTVMAKLSGNRNSDYTTVGANSILINIWNYDPLWTIEVKENGAKLTSNRVYMKDPLHTITYDYPRMRDNGSVTDGFTTGNNPHMFLVAAGSVSSTLEITIKDRFGNVYSETMTRPKQFTLSME